MFRVPIKNRSRTSRRTLRARCQVVRERDFRLVADRVKNLSASGMLVAPADPVLTGERLIVSFRLPQSDFWIDAEAVVSRVVHGRRAGENTRALGVQFDNLDPEARRALELCLCHAPPVPPGRSASEPPTPALVRALARLSATGTTARA
ncbi:MAG: PilZ domain-containing protein [Polyangiaceae bacterium]|nr:PilZ domain-containing protein [Polyangiaceae bacterium]